MFSKNQEADKGKKKMKGEDIRELAPRQMLHYPELVGHGKRFGCEKAPRFLSRTVRFLNQPVHGEQSMQVGGRTLAKCVTRLPVLG